MKMPFSLVHFITERCNARCRHCFLERESPRAPGNELTLREIETLTARLGRGLRHVSLTGGEPFLRDDIFEIVRAYADNTGVRYMAIPTNGAYPERVARCIDRIVAENLAPHVRISVSLDNFEHGHDRDRGVPGLFEKALKTYECIASYRHPRITPAVTVTVTPYNCGDVVALYRHLRGRIRNFSVVLMREEGKIRHMERRQEVLAAYRELCRLVAADAGAEKKGSLGERLTASFVRARMQVLPPLLSRVCTDGEFVSPCPSGTRFGVIRAQGDVYPCEMLADRKLGNLRDYAMDFARLWRSEAAGSGRRFIRDSRCSCTYECAWSVNRTALIRTAAQMLRNACRSLAVVRS